LACSSPSKIAKRNVLDAPAPQTLVSNALAGTGKSSTNLDLHPFNCCSRETDITAQQTRMI